MGGLMRQVGRLFYLVLVVAFGACRPAGMPTPAIPYTGGTPIQPVEKPALSASQFVAALPSTWDLVTEDFENGTLQDWEKISNESLSLVHDGGVNGSGGLSVAVGPQESFLRRSQVAESREGYFSFWLNPKGANLTGSPAALNPGESTCIADIKGSTGWHLLVSLCIRSPGSQGYKAHLEWEDSDGVHADREAGEFDLVGGWQRITLGYRANDWVAAWVNGELLQFISGVSHDETFGDILEIGETNAGSANGSGAFQFDDLLYQVHQVKDIWVDASGGNDVNDGFSRATAVQTIQRAANRAGPGTKVHILPGIYRETVTPRMDGTILEPVSYLAEEGPGTVDIRGSLPSNSLTWTRLAANEIGLPAGVNPRNIFYADLSAWKLDGPPRFLVELDENGNGITRLPLAREPDWEVSTEWKIPEFWWAADGGSDPSRCNPATDPNPDCDLSTRSVTQLTDRSNDSDPAGIEPGNLTALGDLTGATLVALDTVQGHYVYRRTIVAHDVAAGKITVDEACEHDPGSGNPGLGWGSKYFVENKASLLDTPGEWWFDPSSGRLYLWPLQAGSPARQDIEISVRDIGFSLSGRSEIILEGLGLEFYNASAVYEENPPGTKSLNNTLRNMSIRYAGYGVYLHQNVDGNDRNITRGFTLEDSEIAFIDTDALWLFYTWANNSSPASFTHAGIMDTVIRGNSLHDLGFRSDRDSAVGVSVEHPDRLRFEDNHVYRAAHNGVQFSWSVIQSTKGYGFTPGEIKTGGILVKGNTFEEACQLATDCGALKFWGDPPDSHVFRDVLVIGNVFRNTIGWTYISEKRHRWDGGPGSAVQGMGGFGLYVDMASGITAYRNIAYNNAFSGFTFSGVWRDGEMIFYNNIAANSLYGFFISGLEFDTHGDVNTQLANNAIVNNEAQGIWLTDPHAPEGNALIDHNLYYRNGWRSTAAGGVGKPGALAIRTGPDTYAYFPAVADIQAGTPWDRHSLQGDPGFDRYDPEGHNLIAGSSPDFHISPASLNALDRGSTDLPDLLVHELQIFHIHDFRSGDAFDIGPYEVGQTSTSLPVFFSGGPSSG